MTTPLHFDINPDEVELFLQDVNEHILALEQSILQLERADDPEALNTIFRAAHTLKAIAATISHSRMVALTHRMETIFDQMRTQQTGLSSGVIDQILACVDALKILRDEVLQEEAAPLDLDSLLAGLQNIEEAISEQPAGAGVIAHSVQFTATQLASIQQAQPENLLEARVTVTPDVFAPSARLMQALRILTSAGQVIAVQPSEDDLLQNRHEGQLIAVLDTPIPAAEIATRLRTISDLSDIQVTGYATAASQPDTLPLPPAALTAVDNTVRINTTRLDNLLNLVGELVTERTRLIQLEKQIVAQYGSNALTSPLGESVTHLERIIEQLQYEVMQVRLLPIGRLFEKFPRLLRDLGRFFNKQIRLHLSGENTELDRSVIEAIGDPLVHILRNAVDHGLETPAERISAGKNPEGNLWIDAFYEEGHIVITIRDDGRGLNTKNIRQAAVKRGLISPEEASQLDDRAVQSLIFQPAFSTREEVTEYSGRGVGLDVVFMNIKKLNGTVAVTSEPGQGTTFRITLPLTLALLDAMLAGTGANIYAVPIIGINETFYLADAALSSIKGQPVVYWRNQVLPLIYLRQFFTHSRLAAHPLEENRAAVIKVVWGDFTVGLVVDRLIGKQELVIKPLSPIIGNIPGISGCSILGDGRITLILDIPGIINNTIRSL